MGFSSGREHSRLKRHVIDNTIITLILPAELVFVSKWRSVAQYNRSQSRIAWWLRVENGTAKAAMERLTC